MPLSKGELGGNALPWGSRHEVLGKDGVVVPTAASQWDAVRHVSLKAAHGVSNGPPPVASSLRAVALQGMRMNTGSTSWRLPPHPVPCPLEQPNKDMEKEDVFGTGEATRRERKAGRRSTNCSSRTRAQAGTGPARVDSLARSATQFYNRRQCSPGGTENAFTTSTVSSVWGLSRRGIDVRLRWGSQLESLRCSPSDEEVALGRHFTTYQSIKHHTLRQVLAS